MVKCPPALSALGRSASITNYQNISTSSDDQTNPAVAGQESNGQFLVTWTEPSTGMILYTGIRGRVVTIDPGFPIIEYPGDEAYIGG